MEIKPGMERVCAQWKITNTSYEKAIIDFGERWATLMEQGMSEEDAKWEAGREEITGQMEDRARTFLKACWTDGGRL